MKNFLNKIGINDSGYFGKDKSYIIDIESSDDYNKYYAKLSKNELLEENEDSSIMSIHISNVMFISDNFSLNLIADFDQDIYKLVVTELEGE